MASNQGQGMSAEGYGVVTARDIKGIKGKNITVNVETGGGEGVLCADKVSYIDAEGDVDVSVKTSSAGAGPKKN